MVTIPGIVKKWINLVIIIVMRSYFLFIDTVFCVFHLFTTRNYVTKPSDGLLQISATQAVALIAKRELQSIALVEAYIHRIEQVNGLINAVIIKCFDEAREKARDIDTRIVDMDDNELAEYIKEHPLAGVPFTMKDAIEVEGKVITCGIYYRKDAKCTKTAEAVKRMEDAGGILLGITNVPEVCMWIETSNTVYGRTKNPYDSRRMVGGSSGGEGAVIGAAASLIGIGSDIGGSIRIPSFMNGIFGLKATPGTVSLDGIVPTAEGYRREMLSIGPMCRYAVDLELVLRIMAGSNIEKLSLETPVHMRKLRLFYMEGIQENSFIHPLNWEMKAALRKAVKYFEVKYDLVAHRVDLPLVRHALEYFLTSMDADNGPHMSSYMLSSDCDKGDLNCLMEIPKLISGSSKHTVAGVIAGIVDGADVMSDAVRKDLFAKRDRLIREFKELLGSDGIFLFPSFPHTSFFHHQQIFAPIDFSYTAMFNALSLPVVQCPMGLDRKGLPLGVQVVSNTNMDRLLIAVAKDLEEGFGGWTPAGPL